MWAILNTLSGNQDVDDVVIDSSANWTPLRMNGMISSGGNNISSSSINNPNNPGESSNPMINGPPSVPAIKVS